MITLFKTVTKKDIKPETGLTDTEPDNNAVRCRNCLKEITYENMKIEKNGSHIHSFANPYGYIFTIRCFSSAPGAIAAGDSSSEFSWFADYSWKICGCSKCMSHIGWEFSSGDSSFFGLISDKIF
ncbi:MAG: cereblon family protein [Thermodesulfobacteriota bacterium]